MKLFDISSRTHCMHNKRLPNMKKLFLLILYTSTTLAFAGNEKTYIQQEKFFEFRDDSVGFTAKGDTMLRTSDGGITWNSVWVKDPSNYTYTIMFADDTTFYSAQGDELYKSIDKGFTWFKKIGIDGATYSFYDNLNGAALTSDSLLFTVDGGDSWSGITHDLADQYNRVIGLEYFDGAIYVRQKNGPYFIFLNYMKSTDQGVTWKSIYYGDGYDDVEFVSKDTIMHPSGDWGTHAINKTYDGGNTWVTDTIPSTGELDRVRRISSADGKNIVASCYATSEKLTVICSNDGGMNWHLKEYADTLKDGTGVELAGLNSVWVFGDVDGSATGIKMINTVQCFNIAVGSETLKSITPNIFPNPANETLNVNVGPEQAQVELFDATGSLVQEKNGTYVVAFSIAHLKPGLYFVKVIGSENRKTSISKLIVE